MAPGCATRALLVLLLTAASCCTAHAQDLSCETQDGLVARAAGLQSTCCPGGPISCPVSIPTYCSSDCSNALLTFVADCNAMFTAAGLGPAIAPVVAVCEAAPTAGTGAAAEVGGSAMDHFGDDELASCTNVAAGQPASQSSVGWGGEASRAVDGAGLDGAYGSDSCSHTQNTGPQWWQVDLGTTKEVRAIQLVNRADCCQDRLVGARVIVSATSDYTAREGRNNCGSVTQAESEAGAESVIIKTCNPGTLGRYVTVAAVPDTYLALCEVAVFADCTAGGGGAAGGGSTASSLGANCRYSISGADEPQLSRDDAEAACVANGGHLASIHSDADTDAVAALDGSNGAWLGLSDLNHECGCDGDCFEWSDGTPNDYSNWGAGEPNDWQNGAANCDGGAAGIGSVGDDDGGEDCVHVRGDFKWNEASCQGARQYVCRTCLRPAKPGRGGGGH